VRRHTLVNGLSEAGAGAQSGCRTNNLWLGYGPHLIHQPPIVKTYKALQLTADPLRGLSAAELGRYVAALNRASEGVALREWQSVQRIQVVSAWP